MGQIAPSLYQYHKILILIIQSYGAHLEFLTGNTQKSRILQNDLSFIHVLILLLVKLEC